MCIIYMDNMFTINSSNFHGLWFLRSEIRAKKGCSCGWSRKVPKLPGFKPYLKVKQKYSKNGLK